MRIGFQVILYILILNLVSTLIYALQIPGTAYSQVIQTGSEAEALDLAAKFNSTSLLDQWMYTPLTVDWLGIFTFVNLLYNTIRCVLVGFPDLINSYAYAIPDATARGSVLLINYVIYAVESFIIFLWIFQIVTGRRVSE